VARREQDISKFFGRVIRKPENCFEKENTECTTPQIRRKTAYNVAGHHQDVDRAIVDGSSEVSGEPFSSQWRKIVHDAARPRTAEEG